MNIEQRIQSLKDVLNQLIQEVSQAIASGENIDESVQQQAVELMEEIVRKIVDLRGQAAQQPEVPTTTDALSPSVQPALQQTPHPSSNINAFKYDPKSQQLMVKFQGEYPKQNGPVYSYQGVPEFIVDVFARGAVAPKTSGSNQWHTWKKNVTPSHGAAMNALIKKGAYQYQRVA